MISADKAIPLGLLINELVNDSASVDPDASAKSGYPARRGAAASGVGSGWPAGDFDIDQPRASLGFKVIKSLLAQLGRTHCSGLQHAKRRNRPA